MKIKLFIALLLVVFQVQATDNSPQNNKEVVYNMTAGLSASDFKIVAPSINSDGLELFFPIIPNGLFGETGDLLTSSKVVDGRFELHLPTNIDDKLSTFSVDGVTISPADTKVGRLGTFHQLASYKEDEYHGGAFVNKENGSFVILTYFSNPATLTGNNTLGDEKIEHNIHIDKEGWNWIEMKKLAKNRFKIMHFDGELSNVEFAVPVANKAKEQ